MQPSLRKRILELGVLRYASGTRSFMRPACLDAQAVPSSLPSPLRRSRARDTLATSRFRASTPGRVSDSPKRVKSSPFRLAKWAGTCRRRCSSTMPTALSWPQETLSSLATIDWSATASFSTRMWTVALDSRLQGEPPGTRSMFTGFRRPVSGRTPEMSSWYSSGRNSPRPRSHRTFRVPRVCGR